MEEIIDLLKESHRLAGESGGDSGELQKSQDACRKALQKIRQRLENERDDIRLWQMMLGCMDQGGVWTSDDGEYDETWLEVVEHMIRLNPQDDDAAYDGSYWNDGYSEGGGLYYLHFHALADVYYFGDKEEGWPDSDHGVKAAEALRKAVELHPEKRDFLQEEAEAVDIVL
ncbi:hypothetical protein ACFL6C_05780 [Myxococcota bacterium]